MQNLAVSLAKFNISKSLSKSVSKGISNSVSNRVIISYIVDKF